MEKILLLIPILPIIFLVIYVILNQFAAKTKTKADDIAKEVVGEILEGLGKEVPKPIDPLQVERDKAKAEKEFKK